MKKFEMFLELSKCDPETRSEQVLFGKIASVDLHVASLPQTLQVKKKKKGREEKTLQCLQSAVK